MGFVHLPVSVKAPGVSPDRYDAVFLVDTGALESMAPSNELRRIGIQPVGRETYELADGSSQEFDYGIVQLEFMGKITAGNVLFGPDNAEPLLGVTALESAGLAIDPRTQTLRPLIKRM